jgi:hypothetical protein
VSNIYKDLSDAELFTQCLRQLEFRLQDIRDCFNFDSISIQLGLPTSERRILTIKSVLESIVSICDSIELTDDASIKSYSDIKAELNRRFPWQIESEVAS